MREIRFNTMDNDEILDGIYKTHKLGYVLCTPEKGGVSEQLCFIFSCRETIIGHVPNLLEGKRLSTRNTWIAIHRKIEDSNDNFILNFEQHAKNAAKLVNHFERRNKWFLSKLYKAKHTYGNKNHIYIFKSSRWWLTSPHTFSLYMLLLRIASQEGFSDINKHTSNESVVKLIAATPDTNRDHKKTRDVVMWNTLLDNRRKIFGKKGPNENFKVVTEHNEDEGILTLTNGSCEDNETYDKFITFYKESCKSKDS